MDRTTKNLTTAKNKSLVKRAWEKIKMSVYNIKKNKKNHYVQEKSNFSQRDNDFEEFTKRIEQTLIQALGNVNATNLNFKDNSVDSYKNEKSLERLANSMIEEREIKETNSKNIGQVRETKKNIDDDIDFLSGIE